MKRINQPRKNHTGKAAAKKQLPNQVTPFVYTSLEDFLKKVPVYTVNEYGDHVIRGMRVC